MPATPTPPVTPHRWIGLGASVRGASHVRQDLPNQDALALWPKVAQGTELILAVADGHGGSAYTRSHIGAAYAVRIAQRILAREVLPLFPTAQDDPDLPSLKRTCEEWLPKLLVRRWQDRVLRHARRYPLGDGPGKRTGKRTEDRMAERMAETPESGGEIPPAHRPEEPSPHRPDHPILRHYGATLIAALLTPRVHLYLQLGDGDILLVGEGGEVSALPLAADERLLANETTSLCGRNAWQDVRIHFQPVVSKPPALVMLATDGYANSFVDGEAFAQVGGDLLAALESEGAQIVADQLPEWLQATSTAGSGDDITVALGWRSPV